MIAGPGARHHALDAEEKLQTALLNAKPGDTVAIAAGRCELADGLSLDIADVTVKGAGPAGRSLVDEEGLALVREYIARMQRR